MQIQRKCNVKFCFAMPFQKTQIMSEIKYSFQHAIHKNAFSKVTWHILKT